MKHKIAFLVFGCAFMIAACGGSSSTDNGGGGGDTTAPTITSVTDIGGTAIEATGTTGITPTPISITFSTAMDSDSVTEAGNITLVCGGTNAEISVAASTTENTYTITMITDPSLYGYQECILTVTTNVQSASDVALASNSTYVFNNACSTSDYFGVDTLGFESNVPTADGNCWTYHPSSGINYRNWYYTVTNGVMEYNSGSEIPTQMLSNASGHFIYKTFDAPSFTATIDLLTSGSAENTSCGIIAATDFANSMVYFHEYGGQCGLSYGDPGAPTTSPGQCGVFTAGTPLILRMVYSDGTITAQHRTITDDDFSNTVPPISYSLESPYKVGIWCESEVADFIQDIDSFVINATATGPGTQY